MSYDYGYTICAYDEHMRKLFVEGDISTTLSNIYGRETSWASEYRLHIEGFWGDWEEDMCRLSEAHPHVYFVVERKEEEADFERAFFTRGMLLTSIYGEVVYKYDHRVAEGGNAKDVIVVSNLNDKFNPYD